MIKQLSRVLGSPRSEALKLYIFRYVQNVVSGEFANIAVCLVEDSPDPKRFICFETTNDWVALHRFFPDADIEFLRNWCRGVAAEIRATKTPEQLLSVLENLSTNIDVVVSRYQLTKDQGFEHEIRALISSYLGQKKDRFGAGSSLAG
jgi:hypothetical protein